MCCSLFSQASLVCLCQFTLLLKTALSLALVRFLVHSIHSDTLLFQENCKKDIVLAKSSIPLKSKRAHAHAHSVSFVLDTQSTKIEKASRLVPSLKGEGIMWLKPFTRAARHLKCRRFVFICRLRRCRTFEIAQYGLNAGLARAPDNHVVCSCCSHVGKVL